MSLAAPREEGVQQPLPGQEPLVLVADPIAQEGLSLLGQRARLEFVAGDRAALERRLGTAEALLVRSETRVTAALLESAPRLRVIGRAGAGVDTIDVEAATARGIVVVNAPGGNAVAAAEHTLALMFALARRVAAADASLKRGQWSRSAHVGTELTGKTLGLVGLGRVGGEVARRALGLDMHVLVYDPYVPDEHARHLGLEPVELDALLDAAEYVSLHVPLTEATRGILSAGRIARMRPGAFVINCARGGLVDEAALLTALDEGRLGGAGVDVFSTEPVAPDDPLPRHPKVVATPHLGASTVEAQANVAAQVANEVLAVLEGRPTQFAVNAPSLRPEDVDVLEPYMGLMMMLGKLATQLADDHLRSAEISYRGEIAERNVGVFRTGEGLQTAIDDVRLLKERFRRLRLDDKSRVFNTELMGAMELENLLDAAETVVAPALMREESRGSQARRDFPERDDQHFLSHSLAFKTDDGPRIEWEEAVITKWEPEERKY